MRYCRSLTDSRIARQPVRKKNYHNGAFFYHNRGFAAWKYRGNLLVSNALGG
jgi:hypothetical protein